MANTIDTSYSTAATSGTGSKANANTDPTAAQDRFLTLLVAQLNNQDPMNPMDNAQMTSQMAQINTVTGIQQVNQTLKNMAEQFTSLQVLQGASMVGRDVIVSGSTLTLNNGTAKAAIDLAADADSVKIEVVTPGGQVVDTINLGAQKQGQHSFDWASSTYANSTDLSFRIKATSGGKNVPASPLTQSKVVSVSTGASGLSLQLQGRTDPVAYGDIRTIL